ncbi:ABC-2 type transport system permease protein [Micromonospora kangleipakensis]|uniref:Transport permease protein n=1 Tax=Micromonospora kangleipakensis TaxID=1077942 RepID=A0A4Q8B5X8_9ACTN|nr:ABC transporter permease [Micromonospora kangleipakensis]RZU73014.1 ABC-2 type transport system permease protein [Micromonospora kangleipakensis]
MTTLSHTLGDSATMLRRNLRHALRYPSLTLMVIALPVIFLLLFVYVFGGTLGDGLDGVRGGRAEYVNYVTPGILLLAIAGAAQGTAISVAMDMTEGIVARFRTMSIARASVLTGHVLGSVLQTMLGLAVVVGIALLVGFRPTAGPLDWLAAGGLLVLVAFAVTWLSVALGMVTKSVETASNLPMPLMLLPFLGSGFVPTASMPVGLRWFAEYQPFTPIIETLRGLLLGAPIGASAGQAVAWCAAISLAGYLWARRLYDRDPSR